MWANVTSYNKTDTIIEGLPLNISITRSGDIESRSYQMNMGTLFASEACGSSNSSDFNSFDSGSSLQDDIFYWTAIQTSKLRVESTYTFCEKSWLTNSFYVKVTSYQAGGGDNTCLMHSLVRHWWIFDAKTVETLTSTRHYYNLKL